MADPIKTLVLKAIKMELEGILLEDLVTPLFTKVVRNPSKPIDHDFFKSPMCFVFDDSEQRTRRNRLADVILPIQIEGWIKTDEANEEEDLSDQADIIEAEVHKALVNSTDIKVWAKDIFPDTGNSSTKFYVSDYMGGVILRYTVKYLHVWGDPYDIGRQ